MVTYGILHSTVWWRIVFLSLHTLHSVIAQRPNKGSKITFTESTSKDSRLLAALYARGKVVETFPLNSEQAQKTKLTEFSPSLITNQSAERVKLAPINLDTPINRGSSVSLVKLHSHTLNLATGDPENPGKAQG